ncbi:MAG: type I-C CRISPR-associated protein Cas8c/Csd1 [Alphaproteobacteria bacterium]
MILSALARYYERRCEAVDPAMADRVEVPAFGYRAQGVGFALVLTAAGRVASIRDLRRQERRKLIPRTLFVPEDSRTSGDKAFFLCDKADYLFGATAGEGKGSAAAVVPTGKRATLSHALHHRLLAGCDDAGARALRAFFDAWRIDDLAAVLARSAVAWEDVGKAFLALELDDEPGFLHDRPALRATWAREYAARGSSDGGQCLVTGTTGPIARLHQGLKLPGTTGNGAPFVSFNTEAFCSYGLGPDDKGLNAPVGEWAAFAYATGLADLLRNDRRRLRLGDTTVVFWAERPCPAETTIADLFNPPLAATGSAAAEGPRELDPSTAERLYAALSAMRDGRPPTDDLSGGDPGIAFHVLGLATPAGSRVSVRLWQVTTLEVLVGRIGRHYRALAIEKAHAKEPEFLPLWLLLVSTAPEGKSENVSPPLAAALTRAVLTGGPYPAGLLATVLNRVRAEHSDRTPVSYPRAALIKACLARSGTIDQEAYVTLNTDSDTPVAYKLGRLFAVLERAQLMAHGREVNATITDRYFGSVSSSPRTAFPPLLRLLPHHLAKIDASRWLDNLIGRILEGIDGKAGFPAHLSLEEQGLFALGYYHQRNDFFKPRRQASSDSAQPAAQTEE